MIRGTITVGLGARVGISLGDGMTLGIAFLIGDGAAQSIGDGIVRIMGRARAVDAFGPVLGGAEAALTLVLALTEGALLPAEVWPEGVRASVGATMVQV